MGMGQFSLDRKPLDWFQAQNLKANAEKDQFQRKWTMQLIARELFKETLFKVKKQSLDQKLEEEKNRRVDIQVLGKDENRCGEFWTFNRSLKEKLDTNKSKIRQRLLVCDASIASVKKFERETHDITWKIEDYY